MTTTLHTSSSLVGGTRGFPIMMGPFYPSASTSTSSSSPSAQSSSSPSSLAAATSSAKPASGAPHNLSVGTAIDGLGSHQSIKSTSNVPGPVTMRPSSDDSASTPSATRHIGTSVTTGSSPTNALSAPQSGRPVGLAGLGSALPATAQTNGGSLAPRAPAGVVSSSITFPGSASATGGPLMKVNIVPKRASGTLYPQGASVYQRAYLEASERELASTSSIIAGNGGTGMPKELAELEHLLVRESQLLEQLKLQFKTGHHPASLSPQLSASPHNQELINELPLLTSEQQSKRVAQELRTVIESKKAVLSTLMPSLLEVGCVETKEAPSKAAGATAKPADRVLSITSQPAEIAVANRYLMPGPVISVATGQLQKSETGTLIVSVKLLYHASGKEVTTTLHGKQDILQGIKQVTVDKLGRAIFNKLKVMEVSSKHRHQSFCLEFLLEEYSSQGLKRTLANAKSTPFHVQSRPAKRKRDESEEESSYGREAESNDLGPPNDQLSGQKKGSPNKEKKMKRSTDASVEGADDAAKEASSTEGNYIDITDLLTLPQKEAAKKLGISESMLCKRFKECTRRKWPYRYLRKIDKIINMLNLHKADGEGMSEEDRDKLTRLHKEREECLRPVKIRITSYDRLSPGMRHRKASDCDEEDIPIDALQTLEMLRIFKPQGEGEMSESGSAEQDGNSSSEEDEDELDDEDDLRNSNLTARKESLRTDEGLDIDGEEDESECSMQVATDDLEDLEHEDIVAVGALPIFSGSIPQAREEGEETVASGKVGRHSD